MTHEEFAEKHPHPPSPFYVKIDRQHEPAVDRQRETDIDRPPSPLIDRRAPLTYQVRLPSIDSDRINALRPPPKPLANPPEPTTNPSDTTQEPIKDDEATEGRRETNDTEEDIRRMFHHAREWMKLRITLKKKSDLGKFAIPCVVNLVELGNDLAYIAACHCGAEYETEYSESIDTHTASSIDSNESPTTDEHYPTSLDGKHPVDQFTLPDQFYPDFAFQQPNKKGRDDYSIGSWAQSGLHESFAVETVILSSNEDPTEEYDVDSWKERAIEIAMQDERYSRHSFNNTSPPSIDKAYSASVDTHPHLAKRSYASIDTTPDTSFDIRAAAFEKEKGNIPIPSSAARIMTHEEFAEKHPHPPSPFYVKIDQLHEPAVNRQRETDIDRPPSPPIDRRAPLTYRVRLPSIDCDRINTLRPPPKPLANPPEPTTNPSDTTPEPMKVDEATEGRRLRKKKEKIPKNLKREANEKEMDETKETEEDIGRMFHQVREMMKLRITLKKKSDPGKLAIPYVVKACHCGAEYKTDYSESIDTHTVSSIDSNESPTTDEHYPTSLDEKHPVDHFTLPDQFYPNFAFQQPNKKGRDDYSIGSWADSGFHESFAVETVIPSSNEDPNEEYDEDYWKERAIEIAMQDERYSRHSFNNTSPPSIDRVYSASVDTHPHPAK
ncbi:hypothetical protein DY000_02007497 [Brassica cretica]|uniref:Uncharacterized protein n=1 Tax=Brassica cretica TaxID=69181 RepID=A0ABQ7CG46_BRACR|nr:hypothetical protein DY000_02007497 [Brassica cretica]